MAVYIDREALLQYIKKSVPYMYHPLAIITNMMPPADVVPVVWCKDCRYSKPVNGKGFVWCAIWGEDLPTDGYCYNGTRMDGEPDG